VAGRKTTEHGADAGGGLRHHRHVTLRGLADHADGRPATDVLATMRIAVSARYVNDFNTFLFGVEHGRPAGIFTGSTPGGSP
jgi:hypothetical protein